jgi:diaminohydroxyphosphoribosylaminopyrimidine deaminase/5-amino-6-(5-phosphoribosylamino)uracil reductase
VLIEGGPTLAWSAVQEGVVDRFVLYLAPKLVGGTAAPGILGGEGIGTLADAAALRIRSIERLGDDLKVVAVPAPGEA